MKNITIMVLTVIITLASATLVFAATADDLQSQLSTIEGQIASINAQIAQLRAQLAQLQGQEGSTDEQSDQGDASDDEYDWSDGEHTVDDEDWITDRINEEASGDDSGNLPDWAQDIGDREREPFPTNIDEMTGGGVYTNRGVGGGQKITDWNSGPLSTTPNTRTRDEGDYGPTEGGEGDHSHEQFPDEGEWTDERPAGTGTGAGTQGEMRGAGTSGSSSGWVGGEAAHHGGTTTSQSGSSTSETTTQSDGDSTNTPSGQNETSGTSPQPGGTSGSGLGPADVGLAPGFDGTAPGANTGGTGNTVSDRMITTEASSEDAQLYGDAVLGDGRSGSEQLSTASSSSTTQPTSQTQSSATRVGGTSVSSHTATANPWAQGGTTSKDSNILPGNQSMPRPNAQTMRAAQHSASSRTQAVAASAETQRQSALTFRDSLTKTNDTLTALTRQLQQSFRSGDITQEIFETTLDHIGEARQIIDGVKSISAVNMDVAEDAGAIRGHLQEIPMSKDQSIVAVEEQIAAIDQVLRPVEVEAIRASLDSLVESAHQEGMSEEQRIFVDSVEMLGMNPDEVVEGIEEEPVEQKIFVDTVEVLGSEEPMRRIEVKPVLLDDADENSSQRFENTVIEGTEEEQALSGPLSEHIEEERQVKYIK